MRTFTREEQSLLTRMRDLGGSEPLPGVKPPGWLGVLVQFDDEAEVLDVDPADLEPVR